MSKATAVAPANIAFIKYWGKANDTLRLPLNASISMNISGAYTVTTIEFAPQYREDTVTLLPPNKTYKIIRPYDIVGLTGFTAAEKQRLLVHLDRIREKAGTKLHARLITYNSFPQNTGIASSASGFAALTVAGCAALGLHLSEKELTILARLGSGSACRSIPDGFVYWKTGETSNDSHAFSLYPHTYWDLRDILVIVDQKKKGVPSSAGMKRIQTSPFWKDRVVGIAVKIAAIQDALKRKDIRDLGIVIEEDCINMHAVIMTQNPPLFYWNWGTVAIIQAVKEWRAEGLSVYFTIDAGPNVHLICEAKDEHAVIKKAKAIPGVEKIIVNNPAPGAHVVKEDLF